MDGKECIINERILIPHSKGQIGEVKTLRSNGLKPQQKYDLNREYPALDIVCTMYKNTVIVDKRWEDVAPDLNNQTNHQKTIMRKKTETTHPVSVIFHLELNLHWKILQEK